MYDHTGLRVGYLSFSSSFFLLSVKAQFLFRIREREKRRRWVKEEEEEEEEDERSKGKKDGVKVVRRGGEGGIWESRRRRRNTINFREK